MAIFHKIVPGIFYNLIKEVKEGWQRESKIKQITGGRLLVIVNRKQQDDRGKKRCSN
jgi:hypothetical protein